MTPCLTMPNDRTEAEARASSHTPTPWSCSRGQLVRIHQAQDPKHGCIAGVHLMRKAEIGSLKARGAAEANATFIVLAVNSYDAMRAALEAVLNGPLVHLDGTVEPKVRAALALARGAK